MDVKDSRSSALSLSGSQSRSCCAWGRRSRSLSWGSKGLTTAWKVLPTRAGWWGYSSSLSVSECESESLEAEMTEGEEGVVGLGDLGDDCLLGGCGDDCLFGGDGLLDEAGNGVIDGRDDCWFDGCDDCWLDNSDDGLSNGSD